MRASYRFKVSGRVQGVFFRQSTVQIATGLGLDGWVHNCADGSVQGVASGDADALERLRQWLQQGPSAARVVQVDWQRVAEVPAPGFLVRR